MREEGCVVQRHGTRITHYGSLITFHESRIIRQVSLTCSNPFGAR